jgi:DNA-binding GntR family transcriptional regulator
MGRAVQRRSRPVSAPRHSRFTVKSPLELPNLAQLGHTFELAAFLEAHAVMRVAAVAQPDLIAARGRLAKLDRVIESRQPGQWASLEIGFHRALDAQCGNGVLAALAERTLRDGLAACPILSPDVLRVLQSHHRNILRGVEERDADAAVLHTRTHMLFLRDALATALPRSPHSTQRLPT